MAIQSCKGKRGLHVRGHAERIGDTSRFRFICPRGHVSTKDINGGKLRKRFPVDPSFFAHYWSKDGGGVYFECKKCLDEK